METLGGKHNYATGTRKSGRENRPEEAYKSSGRSVQVRIIDVILAAG